MATLQERQRLARELHDSVTQSLYSVTLLAETGRRLAAAGDLQRATDYLARVGETGQQALKEMRLLVYELRPLALEREGLVGALQLRLDAVERRAGVDARLRLEGSVALAPAIEAELYNIAQEALNNALKHAGAAVVMVTIRSVDGAIELIVADQGRGFNPAAARDSGGLGLVSIRERAERLGATVTIASRPGQGTAVCVHLPRCPTPPADTSHAPGQKGAQP